MLTDSLTLPSYVEDAYLQYAMAVVKGRALADVEDGLKPVQRRILYAMLQLGLRPPAKAVKSARVVGDVLGKYHPHGDQSVYDALVRMAQPFTLRYPLIEGQGNFGSLDGDSAAAMRYTEARLSPLADLLLAELHQGTVDWVPNYDGTLKEPALTPSRLPEILLNGTSGIAVGMAASMPSHNLREVCRACVRAVKNPNATLDDFLLEIAGPDFPGGGQLVSPPEDIRAVYSKGRGSLRCRARWVKEDLARNQWQMVVTELPYQVSTRVILEQLDTLTNPQPPAGKKTITQQQANLKMVALDFLEKAVDESDKDSGIRLVLTPRNSKVDPDALMAFLLANTSLEDSVSVNATLIGLNGNPTTLGLAEILHDWANFRIDVVRRRTRFELEASQRRIHILEGRLTAFNNLDAVVQVIRGSEDPKPELMGKFGLSEAQAEDILEMRLRQLNKLEGQKLEVELKNLREQESKLLNLLANEPALRELIVAELESDAARFGDDRRTLVQPEARTRHVAPAKAVLDEPVTVVVSKNLWVRAYKGHGLPEEAISFKAGDGPWAKVETTTTRPTVVLDSAGRAYSFDTAAAPQSRGEGVPLSTFLELQDGAVPHALLAGGDEDLYLFAGELGYGFLAPFKSLVSRPRAGKSFLKLEPGERPMPPLPVARKTGDHVLTASDGHKLLAFPIEEVKVLASGGKGVVLMDVGEGGRLAQLRLVQGESAEVRVVGKSGQEAALTLAGEAWSRHLSRRGRKGCHLAKKEALVS